MIKVSDILCFLDEKEIGYNYQDNGCDNIESFSSVFNIKERSITWLRTYDENHIANIKRMKDIIVITNHSTASKLDGCNIICVDKPKMVFFEIVNYFFISSPKPFISKLSSVETMEIGNNVSIGNFCTISKEVIIGNNVTIAHGVQILCPTQIGDNCIISSGVIIGSNGFGYYQDSNRNNALVPHVGGVKIGNNVDIGANTCIDRGTIENTVIGDYTKIDNLCHIAHNVIIGKNVFVIAQSMIGGSAIIEDDAYIAPGVNIKNQIRIHSGAMAGMGAVVTKDVENNIIVTGVPAKKYKDRESFIKE